MPSIPSPKTYLRLCHLVLFLDQWQHLLNSNDVRVTCRTHEAIPSCVIPFCQDKMISHEFMYQNLQKKTQATLINITLKMFTSIAEIAITYQQRSPRVHLSEYLPSEWSPERSNLEHFLPHIQSSTLGGKEYSIDCFRPPPWTACKKPNKFHENIVTIHQEVIHSSAFET